MSNSIVALPAAAKRRTTRSIRLMDQIWDDLGRMAERTKRTRSNLIEIALEEFLQRHERPLEAAGR